MTDLPPEVHVIHAGDEQGRGGLYNMLVPGAFERTAVLLPIIGIDPERGGLMRLRDAWVEKHPFHGLVIHVYTRLGGNNRADYQPVIDQLRSSSAYVRDDDDSFDNTYASFWFRVPKLWMRRLSEVAIDPVDTAQRWRTIIDALGGTAPQ